MECLHDEVTKEDVQPCPALRTEIEMDVIPQNAGILFQPILQLIPSNNKKTKQEKY